MQRFRDWVDSSVQKTRLALCFLRCVEAGFSGVWFSHVPAKKLSWLKSSFTVSTWEGLLLYYFWRFRRKHNYFVPCLQVNDQFEAKISLTVPLGGSFPLTFAFIVLVNSKKNNNLFLLSIKKVANTTNKYLRKLSLLLRTPFSTLTSLLSTSTSKLFFAKI